MTDKKQYTFVMVDDLTKPSPYSNRTYPKKQLQAAIDRYKASNPLPLGELGHGENLMINFSNVSHKIIDTSIKNNQWVVTIEPLATPKGIALEDLILRNQVRFGVRGVGSINSKNEITDDFKIIAIDALSIGE